MASIHVCLQHVQYSYCFLNLKHTAVLLLQTDHKTVSVFVRHHLAVASVPEGDKLNNTEILTNTLLQYVRK